MSREQILGAVRRNKPDPVELPDLDINGITYDNVAEQFSRMLDIVGGRAVDLSDRGTIPQAIRSIYPDASTIYTDLKELDLSTVTAESMPSPADWDGIDLVIARGEFGVAETAAIWVDGEAVHHPVLYVITEHLVLLLDKASIVHNMHQAYDKLSLPLTRYGIFISGPSKTADVEQSLVMGAHGPRSLTVLLLD